MKTTRPYRVAIVGGGFSGATAAVQLVRRSDMPVAVCIFEPRESLGRGLAYSSDDPDHRLNGVLDGHVLDPEDPYEFERWWHERVGDRDAEAFAPNGSVFARRSDFGAFLGSALADYRTANAVGSTIRHVRQSVRGVDSGDDRPVVRTGDGCEHPADMVVLATGNAMPEPAALFSRAGGDPAGIVVSPYDDIALRSIAPTAKVLVVGSGLTALDILTTLLRAGHETPIDVVSRRGLRPHPNRLTSEVSPRSEPHLISLIDGPLPPYLADFSPSVRWLTRRLRLEIRRSIQNGATWHEPFDALRNVVWKVWPQLPPSEQRRFLRRLRSWYDVHRFRAPPQNDVFVRAAEAEGTVRFRAARVSAVQVREKQLEVELIEPATGTASKTRYDAVVNCTGLDPASGAKGNPLLETLLARGTLTVDASGTGFAVDARCRPIAASGEAASRLYAIGPPTTGTFGDPLGSIFIAAQVQRLVPLWIEEARRHSGPLRTPHAIGARD
ncbi:MAG: FAD/NAD(P)-binding protein [Lautropia sp.]